MQDAGNTVSMIIEDVIRSIFNVGPSQRRIDADLQFMAEKTEQWRTQIIPWEAEHEIEILSLNQQTRRIKQSFEKVLTGVFYSIYQEPMMTFAHKVYGKSRDSVSVTYAATSAHTFIYQLRKGHTNFFIDGVHVGVITPDWMMYSARRHLIGRRTRFSDDFFSIIVWDRQVANLRDPVSVDRINPRAFEIVDVMQEQEFLLCCALAYRTIIYRANKLE